MSERFAWTILQKGQLPLRPDGSVRQAVEHRCTTTLVWPADRAPDADNTLMVDPCFTDEGYSLAEQALDRRGVSFDDIGHIFVTHLHADHMLHLPTTARSALFRPFRPNTRPHVFASIEAQVCPGHHPSQHALHFEDDAGQRVWIAGDAVLSDEWLREWAYFWPNGYGPQQIVEHWRSLARIVSEADVIVPGHDDPLPVTIELVSHLIDTFPKAAYSAHCPDVAQALRARLTCLEKQDPPSNAGPRYGSPLQMSLY
ncbi:MAG: MBL fold metallo-hydrolase [Chloroflexi bacterium]|nr:MBL fold metallo-hydrolase [Chloroflexota bacterium]